MSLTIKSGVASGDEVQAIFKLAKEKNFALPAVNVVSSSTVNAVIETAKELNSPVIVQFSNGGGTFYAGKGLSNVKGLYTSSLLLRRVRATAPTTGGTARLAVGATAIGHGTFVVPHHQERVDLLDHVESHSDDDEDRRAGHEVDQHHAGRVTGAANQGWHDGNYGQEGRTSQRNTDHRLLKEQRGRLARSDTRDERATLLQVLRDLVRLEHHRCPEEGEEVDQCSECGDEPEAVLGSEGLLKEGHAKGGAEHGRDHQ